MLRIFLCFLQEILTRINIILSRISSWWKTKVNINTIILILLLTNLLDIKLGKDFDFIIPSPFDSFQRSLNLQIEYQKPIIYSKLNKSQEKWLNSEKKSCDKFSPITSSSAVRTLVIHKENSGNNKIFYQFIAIERDEEKMVKISNTEETSSLKNSFKQDSPIMSKFRLRFINFSIFYF